MIKFEKKTTMKRTLLFTALSITVFGSAQTLTQADEAAIGTTNNMYLCDSFTVDYEGIIGTGVTWDYSNLVGIPAQTRNIGVIDATTSPNAGDFPTSTFAFEVESSVTSFFNSTTASKISQGFIFNEPTLGLVVAKFNTDDEIVITYPFAYGDISTDTYAGVVDYTLSGVPTTSTLTGNAHATIDGIGTLQLPQSVTLTNVIRYKIIDTSLMLNVPIIGDIEIIRRQFEYYDLANGNLPVLTLTKMTIQSPGATNPISEQQLVLSQYAPVLWLGLDEQSSFNFEVYPNPTQGKYVIKGEFSNNAQAKILDQSGRIIDEFSVSNGMSVDISKYENGMYFMQVTDQSSSVTKTIVKN